MVRQAERARAGWTIASLDKCIWRCRFKPRHITVQILQAKLELAGIKSLGPAAELAALKRLHHLAQPLDFCSCFSALAMTCRSHVPDHAMQHIHVFRQGGEVKLHTTEFTLESARSAQLSAA